MSLLGRSSTELACKEEHHEGSSTDREFSDSLASADGRGGPPVVAGDRVLLFDHNRNGGVGGRAQMTVPLDLLRPRHDLGDPFLCGRTRDVTVNRVSALWAH